MDLFKKNLDLKTDSQLWLQPQFNCLVLKFVYCLKLNRYSKKELKLNCNCNQKTHLSPSFVFMTKKIIF